MKWNDDMFTSNTFEVNKALSEVAALICDEAEAYLAAHPDCDDNLDEILMERYGLAMNTFDIRINQQMTVRGYVTEE